MHTTVVNVLLLLLWLANCSAAVAAPWSSSRLIATTDDGTKLLVANTDSGTLSVVDLDRLRTVAEIAVGREPQAVAVVPGTSLALVTAYRDDLVVIVDWARGRLVKKIAVADEPYGVVVDRSGKRAYVSHDFPGAISVIELPAGQVAATHRVGRFVRGLALSPDGSTLFATEFYTARLLEIDTSTGEVRRRWDANSEYNLCRAVAVLPDGSRAFLPHTRSRTSVARQEGSIFPILSVVKRGRGDHGQRKPIALDTYNGFRAVAMPWDAALTADGRLLLTVYAGSDDMHVSRVLDDDYYEIELLRPAFRVGRNPRAVVAHPDRPEAYVYCTLDFEIAIVDLNGLRIARRVRVTDPPYSQQIWRGKVLFNSALQPMAGRRWVSCAVCHPDGQPDGRTWQMPEGLRNTPSLAGIRYTTPLHWSADRDEVQDFEHTIRGPLMRGRGLLRGKPYPSLGPPNAGRSADLDALAAYCNSFDFSPSPFAPDGKLTELAERGRRIFFREDVGCARCHTGPYFTDRKLHDVGTGQDDPTERLGPAYDTPTLLGVYRTAPYLHHGKAATLLDVLTTFNPEDRHGRTSHLSRDELAALVAFLKSLPYDRPAAAAP